MTRASRPTPACPAAESVGTGPEQGPEQGEEVVAVVIQRSGERPVVEVSGALDASGAPLLEAVVEHVAAADGAPVVLDLSAVEHADTHGLAPALGRDVVIADASGPVRRLLRALGLTAPRAAPRLPRSRVRASSPRHVPGRFLTKG